MTLAITNEFHETIRKRFPEVIFAEEAIQEVMGVSLDELRHGKKTQTNAMARTIFFHLCKDFVRPTYHLSSYIAHSHSMITYWEKIYNDLSETYVPFMRFADKAKKVFNKKIEDAEI